MLKEDAGKRTHKQSTAQLPGPRAPPFIPAPSRRPLRTPPRGRSRSCYTLDRRIFVLLCHHLDQSQLASIYRLEYLHHVVSTILKQAVKRVETVVAGRVVLANIDIGIVFSDLASTGRLRMHVGRWPEHRGTGTGTSIGTGFGSIGSGVVARHGRAT